MIFALDYYIVQKSNVCFIQAGEACAKLNVTKSSMINYLTVVHCMELRELKFAADICEKSTRKYIKENLEYKSNEKCYKDKSNCVSAEYIPNLSVLGIAIPDITMEIEQKVNSIPGKEWK